MNLSTPFYRRARFVIPLAVCSGLLASNVGVMSAPVELSSGVSVGTVTHQKTLTLPIAKFTAANPLDPAQANRVRNSGNLNGQSKPGESFSNGGSFDYAFEAAQDGWYRIGATPVVSGHEFIIDPETHSEVVLYNDNAANDGYIGNVYLGAGKHVLRVQRYFWSGFGSVTALNIAPASSESLAQTARIEVPGWQSVERRGGFLPLRINSGARSKATKLEILLRDQRGKSGQPFVVNIPAGKAPVTTSVKLPLSQAGVFQVIYREADYEIPAASLGRPTVAVMAVSPVAHSGLLPKEKLVSEIDVVAKQPDYEVGGTQIVRAPFGSYRESGDKGYIQQQHADSNQCSFFAYKFAVPVAQKPYRIEVEYPDDKEREMLYIIREAATDAYPLASGPETGGEFQLTKGFLKHSMTFWPRTKDLRILVAPPMSGQRAAAAKIRIYALDGDPQPLDVPAKGGRHFISWYEEGSNFLSIFGASNRNPDGIITGADRWAKTMASQGVDTLMPTVNVYQMQMYPSRRYHTDFVSQVTFDTARVLTLTAEKYGMNFIAEFHPEARELYRTAAASGNSDFIRASGRPNAMVNKDGKYAVYGYPSHGPLHPLNQEWYRGALGEFCDRYKDSPAFKGVSLRLMPWANPALHNFHSLEWGYDDYTVELFEKETGLQVPGEGEGRFKARYDFLINAANKEKWIQWRCDKITDIITQLRDRVRQSRPDLKIVLPVFADYYTFTLNREAGLDYDALNKIDGVEIVNALHSYGRRYSSADNAKMRDLLVKPENLNLLRSQKNGQFLFGAGYMEGTEKVFPPEQIGFPATTPRNWTSGVATPSGRSELERYALALAETGAVTLGDGGNAYTIGQPILRNWMREYRRLPDVPFTPRKDASDPVAVWEGNRAGTPFVFAVNREKYPITINLFTNAKSVTRVGMGVKIAVANGTIRFSLEPFGLAAFQLPQGTKITKATATPPAAMRKRVEAQVGFVAALLDGARDGKIALDGGDRDGILAPVVAESSKVLKAGHLWRARISLESADLNQKVFVPTGLTPPLLPFRADLPLSTVHWSRRNFANAEFGQSDFAHAESLLRYIQPAAGKASLVSRPDVTTESLLSWAGGAKLQLPFKLQSTGRFRLHAVIDGSANALSIVTSDGTRVGFTANQLGTARQLLLAHSEPFVLNPGDTEIQLSLENGTAINQIYLEPVMDVITPSQVAFAGYFPNAEDSAFKKPLAPETGEAVEWKSFPANLSNEAPDAKTAAAPTSPALIGYLKTRLTSPREQTIWLTYTPYVPTRAFLNGQLLLDTKSDKSELGWYHPQKGVLLHLKAGENVLLWKLANSQNQSDFKTFQVDAALQQAGVVKVEAAFP